MPTRPTTRRKKYYPQLSEETKFKNAVKKNAEDIAALQKRPVVTSSGGQELYEVAASAYLTSTNPISLQASQGGTIILPWDSQTRLTEGTFTHDTGVDNSRIYVLKDGIYNIKWNVFGINGGGNRLSWEAKLRVDGVSTDIGRDKRYSRGSTLGSGISVAQDVEIQLTAGQYIEASIFVQDVEHTNPITSVPEACSLMIRKVDDLGGTKGEKGDPGEGGGGGSQVAPSDIVLIPDSALPNSSVKVIIQAKDINSQTVASFGGSVNLTSQSVKLNSFGALIIECFVSIGATEETVGVTLNNGLETIFNSVFSVVNGTIFIPNVDDWTNLSALEPIFTPGTMSPSSNLGSTGTIKQDVLVGTNFIFEFIVNLNPLFSPYGDKGYNLTYDWLSMHNFDGERKQHAFLRNKGYPQLVWRSYLALFPAWNYNMTFGVVNTISRIDGTWFFYNNNVLINSFAETQDFDFTFRLLARQFTYSGIKYINLSEIEAPKEYNDNFLVVGDETSSLTNDGENKDGKYAETAIITPDTGQTISLANAVGNYCNMGAASVQTTFDVVDSVVGGLGRVLIDISGMSSYPVVTGSNFINFLGDFSGLVVTTLEMFVWYDGNNVNHYFSTRPGEQGFVSDTAGGLTLFDLKGSELWLSVDGIMPTKIDLSSLLDIKTVKVTLTSAELLASTFLNTKQVVPQAPAGKAIRPTRATIIYNYGTTPYIVSSTGASVSTQLKLGNSLGQYYSIDMSAGVSFNSMFTSPDSNFDDIVIGNDIVLYVDTDNPMTGGDGTITAYFSYEILDLT